MRALLLALVFAACTTAPPAHDGYSIKAMRRVHGGRLWEPLYRDVSACLARQDFVRKPPLRYRAVQIWFADRISSTLPYLSGARIYGIYLAPRTIILAVPQIDTALAAVVRHEFYHAISNRGHFRGVMEACGITGIPASALP